MKQRSSQCRRPTLLGLRVGGCARGQRHQAEGDGKGSHGGVLLLLAVGSAGPGRAGAKGEAGRYRTTLASSGEIPISKRFAHLPIHQLYRSCLVLDGSIDSATMAGSWAAQARLGLLLAATLWAGALLLATCARGALLGVCGALLPRIKQYPSRRPLEARQLAHCCSCTCRPPAAERRRQPSAA